MSVAVGIDLGTTNSAIARLDGRGRAIILANADGASITPSVICFQPDRVVVGDEAKELQAAGAENVAAFFKRQMGEPHFVFHANGRDHTAADLSALILDRVRQDAELAVGEPVRQAVITVPAYFRNPAREATIQAAEKAGLSVLQLVNEPTAAAIAYGLRHGDEDAGRLILVYDLGGGTFDLTLMRIDREEIRILTSEGDHELGGKDWDDRIVQYVADQFEREHGVNPIEDAVSLTDLLARAEEAKKRLSASLSTRFAITHDGHRAIYELTRATFDGITADLMERTVSLTRKVCDSAAVKLEALDGILLVGGSTRMPMVHEFITRTFGKPPMSGVNVDEAVAQGAAVLAGEHTATGTSRFLLGGARRTVDVTNHSLGMIAINPDQSAYVNTIILPKNEAIPCVQTRPYQFRTRGGTDNRLEIFLTQGETEAPADSAYLGQYVIDAVPHQAGGMATIDITYAYDTSGTVEVSAGLRNGGALPVRVEPLPEDVPARFLSPPPKPPKPEPVTVFLVFDLSGSMSGQPLETAKKAAHGFVDNCDLTNCSIGVMAVADSIKTILDAHRDARRIRGAIDSLSIGLVGYGNSAHPFDDLRGQLAREKGPRFALVLADGVWSDQTRAISAAGLCHEQDINIIAIGFGAADQAFLKAIASSEEGSVFTSLNGLAETYSTIAQTLTETAGGTAPTAASPGRGLLGLFRKPKAGR
ncbi:Hsp70 family protein [Azospirillum formosense]|uniref:Hsp70 family protein n=1 Tax=Azospirillum formosense TaxID=861533 RepID=UPI001C8FF7FE|nr:Hsp70 family protein [Azospirillum formosense]MBY3757171.1 Hsp70 family protein [Azospirillum formosense]